MFSCAKVNMKNKQKRSTTMLTNVILIYSVCEHKKPSMIIPNKKAFTFQIGIFASQILTDFNRRVVVEAERIC